MNLISADAILQSLISDENNKKLPHIVVTKEWRWGGTTPINLIRKFSDVYGATQFCSNLTHQRLFVGTEQEYEQFLMDQGNDQYESKNNK